MAVESHESEGRSGGTSPDVPATKPDPPIGTAGTAGSAVEAAGARVADTDGAGVSAGAPLPREVKVLGAVSFAQDAASEMLYPFLPTFLTVTLGAPPAVVGIVEGVAEATAAIMKAIGGWVSDRIGRRKEQIAAGYGLAALGKMIIAVATVWPLVLVARFVDRVGKGVRTAPRDALLIEVTPPSHRGRALGFHRAADTAGAVLGPVLGLAAFALFSHRIRPVLVLAVVPAVVSVMLVTLVREPARRRGDAAGGENSRPVRVPLPSDYWRTVGVLTLFGLVNFSDALVLLRAQDLGLGVIGVVWAYVLYNVVYATVSYPAGSLSDRIPRRLVYASGLAVFAVAYLGLGLADGTVWVFVLLPLYGCYTALTDGVGKAWVADLCPAEDVGWGLGLFHALTGAGALLAGLWAGLLWGETGRTPFLISGVGALVVAAIVASGLGVSSERSSVAH